MKFEERVQRRQTVYQGGLVQVEKQEVTLPDQSTATREIVRHQPAVALLMIDSNNQLLIERQWRTAAGKPILEIPAGKIEAGETPRAAAIREMNEETRLQAANLTAVASFYTSPGFTDELMTLYTATGLTAVTTALPQDADEQIELTRWDLATAVKAIASGELQDAKTVMAVWYWQAHPELGGALNG